MGVNHAGTGKTVRSDTAGGVFTPHNWPWGQRSTGGAGPLGQAGRGEKHTKNLPKMRETFCPFRLAATHQLG